jgi:hypothetical protein
LTKAAEGDVLEHTYSRREFGRYGEGMKLLLLGLLLLVPGALAFFFLVMRGSDSYLVYLTAGCVYVGLGLTLYASVVLWTDD